MSEDKARELYLPQPPPSCFVCCSFFWIYVLLLFICFYFYIFIFLYFYIFILCSFDIMNIFRHDQNNAKDVPSVPVSPRRSFRIQHLVSFPHTTPLSLSLSFSIFHLFILFYLVIVFVLILSFLIYKKIFQRKTLDH